VSGNPTLRQEIRHLRWQNEVLRGRYNDVLVATWANLAAAFALGFGVAVLVWVVLR
jgi:hypothetical protein